MKRITVGLAIIAAAIATEASAWQPSAEAQAQASKGEVWIEIVRDPAGATARVRGVVDIAASPEVVWNVLMDCAKAPKIVPDLKICRVLERDPQGHWDVREHVSKVWLLPSVRTVFRSEYDAPRSIVFRRIDGNMKIADGSWRLEALDGGTRTRAIYENRLQPDFAVPAGIMRAVLRSEAPDGLSGLREASEAAATQGH